MSRGSTCVYRRKHTFTKSRSKSQKGVEATLWRNIIAWEGRFDLLVFNTHLDPWSLENRKQQTKEIEEFMIMVVSTIHEEQKRKTGVLVMGDFNIKAHEMKEYESTFTSRGWKDLFLPSSIGIDKRRDMHPVHTYAEENELACCPEDYGRIDYIFSVDEINGQKFLPLQCLSNDVLKQTRGEELSDHYPLAIEVIPGR